MATRKKKRKTTPRQAVREKKRAPSMPEMPKTLKFLWGLILAGLIILLFSSAYFFYYNAQDHCEGAWESQNIKVALNSSEYLSAGDIEEMRVTVVNERSETTTITVTLSYAGTSLCLAGDNESHIIGFGSLPAQGRATGRLKVQFPLCLSQLSFQNWPGQQAAFKVWLAMDKQPPQLLDTISLPIMPIPKAKTLGNLSGALLAGLAAWSYKELWEWIRKTEQPAAEAKTRARK